MKKNTWLSFEEAREYVRNLKLKDNLQYQEWCKSGQRPTFIPSNPSQTYKNKGWMGYGDWLGTGNMSTKNRTFVTFEEAREHARNLKFKGVKEWQEWCKSGMKPENIHGSPHQIYKNKGWKGYGDFLGTVKPKVHKEKPEKKVKEFKWMPFDELRNFVHTLGLKSYDEWKEWYRSDKKIPNIPSKPHCTYKGRGWKDWNDFLGKFNLIKVTTNLPENERWIPEYEGRYSVTNTGEVCSYTENNHLNGKKMYGERIVMSPREYNSKTKSKKDGYLIINLWSNGKRKTKTVHRLVALAWIENPLHKRTINHINGNKKDNRVENLEWATHSENNQHANDTGLRQQRGEKNHMCKYPDSLVKQIPILKSQGMRGVDISKKLNLSEGYVCAYLKGKTRNKS